jgi:hypothetical protein
MPRKLKPTPLGELQERVRAYWREWHGTDAVPTAAELEAWTKYLRRCDLEARKAIEAALRAGRKVG